MTNQIKAICWDVDGTLVDSEPLNREKKIAVVANYGISLTEKEARQFDGICDRKCWEWLRQNKGLQIPYEQFVHELNAYYLAHPEKIVPRDGALEAFDYFDALKLPQCAVSSGEKATVDANLAVAGVDTRVLFALNSADVTKTKPDPEPYMLGKTRLCEALGWDAATVNSRSFLVIEDSIPGVIAASRAGMTVIFWPQTPGETCPEADYTVYTKGDLLKICRKLTASNDSAPAVVRQKDSQSLKRSGGLRVNGP